MITWTVPYPNLRDGIPNPTPYVQACLPNFPKAYLDRPLPKNIRGAIPNPTSYFPKLTWTVPYPKTYGAGSLILILLTSMPSELP